MTALPPFPVVPRRLARLGFCVLLGLLFLPVARADLLHVRTKTKGPLKELMRSFPPPLGNSTTTPALLVMPLLSPLRELLPNGRLIVWVGRNDGTPYASATVTVRIRAGDNRLVSAGVRAPTVTLNTDANGLAQVFLAAPEVPQPNTGDGGTGSGSGHGHDHGGNGGE